MSDPRTLPDDILPAQASRLLAASFVARAATLARRGDADGAAKLLEDSLHMAPAIDGLDLLARIRAQQGRLGDAEALWREALELDGACEAAHAGLRRIHELQRRRVMPYWPIGVAAIAVLLVLAITLGVGRETPRNPSGMPHQASMIVAPSPRKTEPAALAPIDGVTTRSAGEELVVTFEQGLFSRGITLAPGARAVLARVGAEIERTSPGARVIVEGHCDSAPLREGSVHRDALGLGLARADVAYRLLRETTRLPVEAFSLRSRANEAPPFAEAPGSRDTRNRTVVIRIRSRG